VFDRAFRLPPAVSLAKQANANRYAQRVVRPVFRITSKSIVNLLDCFSSGPRTPACSQLPIQSSAIKSPVNWWTVNFIGVNGIKTVTRLTAAWGGPSGRDRARRMAVKVVDQLTVAAQL